MRKLLLIFLILTTFAFRVGTDYNSPNAIRNWYFDSVAGSDAGLGTIGSPYKTITKLNSIFPTISPGDSVLFKRDQTFAGTISVNKSGTSLLPITISGYSTGAKPIISGLTNLTTWVSLGANIWECSQVLTVSSINLLLVNGSPVGMGRFPNLTAANGGYLSISSFVGTTSITCATLGNTPNWTSATLVMRPERWIMDRDSITKHTGTLITYTASSTNAPSRNMGFFIENSVLTLDVQNEWYYNPSSRKMRMFSTVNPSTLNVQVATTRTLLTTLVNKSFVTVDGVNFQGANDTAINITAGSNFTVKNVRIQNIGNIGIHSAGTVTSLLNDTTWDCENNGIYCNNSAVNAIVRNCYVYRTHMIAGMGHSADFQGEGINVRGDGALAEFNTVINTGYVGIYMYHNTGIIVQNNIVDSFGMIKDDGGGIYTYLGSSSPVTGCKIKNNIVRNGIGAPLGTSAPTIRKSPGIYLDINTNGFEVTGNSCYQNAENGIFMNSGASANTIYNNTLYNNTGIQFQINSRRSAQTRTNSIKNNIFFAVTNTQQAMEYYSTMFPSDINLFGTIDSNYILRPLNDNLTIIQGLSTSDTTVAVTNMNLASWKTAHPTLDVHSQKAPATITSVNQLKQVVNQTTGTVISPLAGNWEDARNVSYSISISLNNFSTASLIPTASLIIPTITWANPAAITYPTALSGTQLNATANVPGTFSYTPGIGTILNAGTQNLIVLFTPTDGSTYSSASKTVTIVVNKASATMTYSNLTQTYTGLPLAPTITTNPSGLTVISTTYNGVGATPINAGVYAIVSGLTNTNYAAPTISGTFTINKAAATLTASNLNQTYNGSPKPITVVTSPVGLSGVTVTYNGSATVPTNAGTYTVVVTLTNTNYTATPLTTTLTINKATPTVTWANPSAITYGTALSGTQLNATASVAGTFAYTPASGAILNAGTWTLSVDFTPTDGTNYNTVNNTTVSIVVNKAVATLSLSNTTQTYDGTGKSVTVTTSPVGLLVVSVTYDGSATLPINAGSYAVIASLSNSNYTATNATGNLVINKATATIFLAGLSVTYDGSPHAVTVTTVPAGLSTITTTYDGSPTAPTNAASYAVVSSLSNANYQATNATGTLVVNKATPVITWNNPTAITYPTALSGTQLNASANVAGSFVYTPASGTILNAGTGQILSTNFTPTDGTNYFSVNDVTVTITVNKATATLTLSNLAQDYDGNPKPVTVTSSPAGLTVIAITYNGSGTAPSAVGSYPIIATLTNTNYTATPATGNLVISMATGNVVITNINQIYTGSPLPVTVTTSPGSYSTAVTYNGSLTVPTNVNTYTVIATIDDGIHVGADTAIYNIIKATPSITWANPSAITFGTALSGTQLNASSTTAGVFTYTPASGAILNAGTQTLSVSLAPTDAANYNTATKTVTLVVNKATATITLSALTQVYDGTPKSAIATTSPAGLDVVVITYDGSITAPTAVNTYAVVATLTNSNYTATPATGNLVISTASASITNSSLLQTYTGSALPVTVTTNPSGLTYTTTYNSSLTVPTNAGSYTVISTITGGIYTGADTTTFVIAKATPTITWSNPTAISYGTPLSATQLNASSSVAGTFVYSPISGTVLNAGTVNLSTTFTPTDASNYNVVNKIVTIVVNKASATLTLGTLAFTYNGTAKPVSVTSTPAGLFGITITYNLSSSAPTTAGSYTVVASLVNDNYTASNVTGIEVISKANPSVTWVNPTAIKSGTPLTSIQLNATSTISGTFVYTPPAGTVLPTGTRRISATFTPTDTVNYNSITITVPISVFGNPVLDHYIRHGNVNYQELP